MSVSADKTEALLWCIRPQLDLYELRGPLSDEVRNKPLAMRALSVPKHVAFGSVLVATETVNQLRAVERLIGPDCETVGFMNPRPEQRERIASMDHVVEAQRRVRDALTGKVADAVIASFEVQIQKLAFAIYMYRKKDLSQFSAIMVATQHAPTLRALIVAANQQSVPVIYVPHAPVADNCAYADLPASYVALRGEGERDFYARTVGADPALLDVVGNLASDVLEHPLPEIRPERPGVLALSPHPVETIRRIFDAVASADLGHLVVAPHPRSNLDEIRAILPEGWALFEGGRTLDLLAEGPPFLFQFSSGVAWESAALGIPTADIRLDATPVNYPFLADESIYPAIRNPHDALAFAERARRGEIDRDRLRSHARTWCACDGDEAAARLQALIDRVTSAHDPARPARVHDGWGIGGAALTRSWIRASRPARPEGMPSGPLAAIGGILGRARSRAGR